MPDLTTNPTPKPTATPPKAIAVWLVFLTAVLVAVGIFITPLLPSRVEQAAK